MTRPQTVSLFEEYCVRRGWPARRGTVVVEGTSDVDYFQKAGGLLRCSFSFCLLSDLAVVAAGEKDRGGTTGVLREVNLLKSLASLDRLGQRSRRVIGLLDNDGAGRSAASHARKGLGLDEFKDFITLQPRMPVQGSLDLVTLRKMFEGRKVSGLDWEVEDLVGEEIVNFVAEENPSRVIRTERSEGFRHTEWTKDGKSALRRAFLDHATTADVEVFAFAFQTIRFLLGLPNPDRVLG